MSTAPLIRHALAAAASAIALSAPQSAAAQYCPSYTFSSSNNNNSCGIEAVEGTNPTTAEWQPIFDLVAKGPAAWGDAGPTVSDIGQGCGKPEAYQTVAARFPCELIKAIARAESAWKQFCIPTTPSDQVGGPERTIISFDCGYGIAQVTSGMHIGEDPDFDRERVADDPTYNLATGTRILAAKWKATECVGDNQPSVIEHWYSATWAYNGLAYSNNPNNPNFDPARGVWDPSVGGSAPYQEKVFGRMEHTGELWEPTEVAYPELGFIGDSNKPGELPEPSCASPTNCDDTRPTHVTICHDDGEGGQGGAGEGGASASSSSAAGVGAAGGAAGFEPPDDDDAEPQLGLTGDNAGCTCELVHPQRQPGWPVWPWLAFALAGATRRWSRERGRR